MKILAIVVGLVIAAGLYLTPDARSSVRDDLAWKCFQVKPCQAFSELFR